MMLVEVAEIAVLAFLERAVKSWAVFKRLKRVELVSYTAVLVESSLQAYLVCVTGEFPEIRYVKRFALLLCVLHEGKFVVSSEFPDAWLVAVIDQVRDIYTPQIGHPNLYSSYGNALSVYVQTIRMERNAELADEILSLIQTGKTGPQIKELLEERIGSYRVSQAGPYATQAPWQAYINMCSVVIQYIETHRLLGQVR